jgi:uncharacterized protein YukE
MTQIKVDPEELSRFARNLLLFNDSLKQQISRLYAQFNRLGLTWRDQEHRRFAQEFDHTIKVVHRFTDTTGGHVQFLLRKSKAIRRYLKGAVRAIRTGFKEGEAYSLQMMQGKAGEQVALATKNYHSLDAIANQLESLKHGSHFYGYDILGDQYVGSVKVRGIKYSQTAQSSTSYLSSYVKDFFRAIGHIEDDSKDEALKFHHAAELLLEAKEKQLMPVSDELSAVATVAQMKRYLYKYGALFIPDNHVSALIDVLSKKINETPQRFKKFGLNGQEEIQQFLTNRIKPIGIDSDFIAKMMLEDLRQSITPILLTTILSHFFDNLLIL